MSSNWTNSLLTSLVSFSSAPFKKLIEVIGSVVDGEGRKKHACGNCSYITSTKCNLKKHVENIHEKIKRHFCGQWDYASYLKVGLTNHIKMVHEKNRMHSCKECDYSSFLKKALINHIKMMHDNVCYECGYSAKHKWLVDNHRKHIHGIGRIASLGTSTITEKLTHIFEGNN